MTTKTTGTRRTASVVFAVFAMLVSAFTLIGVTAAPAQANTEPWAELPDPSLPGYSKVLEKDAYLTYHTARNKKILFVDTEHEDADGFWFAYRTGGTSGRPFSWHYQPYGLYCAASWGDVAWNGWMNRYWCLPNPERAEIRDPGITANTEECRTTSGYPWKGASDGGTNYACGDGLLNINANALTQFGGDTWQCAPWEPDGTNADGSPKCSKINYPWGNRTQPYPEGHWLAAPDPCTLMPADSNEYGVYRNPTLYAPKNGGDGTCTGEAPAPNCPPDSIHQACTGVPPPVEEPQPTFTGTASYTATMTADGGAAVTKTRKATVKRWKKKVKVSRWKKGRRYSATANAVVKVTKRATVTETSIDTKQATRTATASCTAATQEDADACALDRAKKQAEDDAVAAARDQATSEAKSRARAQAVSSAQKDAKKKAKKASVKKKAKKKAIKKARKKALRKVRAKMR